MVQMSPEYAGRAESVSFMTLDDGDDLIVSFAIPADDFGDVISLTLLRTLRYECFLDPEERGVSLSYDGRREVDSDLLVELNWQGDIVTLRTAGGRRFVLDVHRVAEDEVRDAKRILGMMNADNAFKLSVSAK